MGLRQEGVTHQHRGCWDSKWVDSSDNRSAVCERAYLDKVNGLLWKSQVLMILCDLWHDSCVTFYTYTQPYNLSRNPYQITNGYVAVTSYLVALRLIELILLVNHVNHSVACSGSYY